MSRLLGKLPRRVVSRHPSRRLVTICVLAAGSLVALSLAFATAGGASPRAASCRPGHVCSAADTHRDTAGPAHHSGSSVEARSASSKKPNIVFVLTDDLSMDLVQFMPHVLAMQHDGLTFNDYFVADSLCCPSRASIFTGNFPHDTGIYDNFGPTQGFPGFYYRGEDKHTFAVALQHAGYMTAMMGKFLNGYMNSRDGNYDTHISTKYVPPGWSEWDVAGWGYPEFNYDLNEDGVIHHYGDRPSDYLTNVIGGRGVDFINRAAQHGKPFFLELATFAPHEPYVPAPQDANDFPGLTVPRPPNFDVTPTDAPPWLANYPKLTGEQIRKIDSVFRLRAQAVQSVDRMIGTIEQTLAADGIAQNTYIVFSSDNGLHTGEYRLMPGKETAFDTDIHVPLIVVGPGVPAGTTTDAMAQNVDLAKTFTGLGGTTLPGDGHSLVALLHGEHPSDWRTAILVEHHGGKMSPADPDYQSTPQGNPPTYNAMRTHDFLYVEYVDGEREFYDLRTDPYEIHNLYGHLSGSERNRLHDELEAMHHCHGGNACWAAMHVPTDA
jgi:N-acetylglucosamine-6-sulfatase